MKRSMLVAGLSLLAGCGGADGGYGGTPGDAGPTEDDAEARDVAPLEVGSAVSCEDPDRPGQALTRPCSSACGEGVERCVGNRWQACDARQPVAEDCRTAIDDDCDGVVNEDCGECAPGATRPCPSGPAPVGECRTGVQTCGGDRAWGACVGERRPAEEQCNGADDDCDGAVDDGLVRMCTNGCGAGMQACVAGAWSACTGRSPSPEACNGVDDDCDGSVDEDVTRACSTACGAGTQRCTGGAWGACSARQPEAEVCNGVDDDCDGLRDEDLTRGCSSACGAGTQRCAGGAWSACSAPSPGVEVCNGVDDDCDGLRDEGLTRSCSSACGSGSQTCSGGFWGACSAPSPSVEVCDLRDNNCDGRVDEGLNAVLSFLNTCRVSRVFVTFGGCNACRSTCLGYWLNAGASYPYTVAQNTCFSMSAFARTRFGDVCLTERGGVYDGEVHRVCNGDCRPGTLTLACAAE